MDRLTGERLKLWTIERLTNLRLRTGLSVEDFAAKVGITAAYLYRIERNEHEPSLQIINDWLQVCKMDLATFFEDLRSDRSQGDPEHTKWHDHLDSILQCPPEITSSGVDIANGIKLNLIAIAKEVERVKKEHGRSKTREPDPMPGEGADERKVGTNAISQKKGRRRVG